MNLCSIFIAVLCIFCIATGASSAEMIKEQNILPLPTIHHDINVSLDPGKHSFEAEDTITVPKDHPSEFYFRLHKGLNPSSSTKGVFLAKQTGEGANVLFETYHMTLPQGVNTIVFRYGGIIDHPVMQYGKEQARGYSHTPGLISAEGVYLAANSYWYPVFDGPFVTFRINAELPCRMGCGEPGSTGTA